MIYSTTPLFELVEYLNERLNGLESFRFRFFHNLPLTRHKVCIAIRALNSIAEGRPTVTVIGREDKITEGVADFILRKHHLKGDSAKREPDRLISGLLRGIASRHGAKLSVVHHIEEQKAREVSDGKGDIYKGAAHTAP